MRESAQAAADTVAQVQTTPRGTIRVSCPVTLAQTSVAVLVPLFMRAFPEVRVEMLVTNRVIDLVEEGIDVALRVRPTLEASGSLVIKQLGQTRTILVASPDLLARQPAPKTPEDLARLDSVAMSVSDGRSSWRLLGPEGAEFMHVHRPRYVADDMLTLKLAVLMGMGICVLPDYMCRESCATAALWPCCPTGRRLRAWCMRCFPRAAAWCRRCGASSISSVSISRVNRWCMRPVPRTRSPPWASLPS